MNIAQVSEDTNNALNSLRGQKCRRDYCRFANNPGGSLEEVARIYVGKSNQIRPCSAANS